MKIGELRFIRRHSIDAELGAQPERTSERFARLWRLVMEFRAIYARRKDRIDAELGGQP